MKRFCLVLCGFGLLLASCSDLSSLEEKVQKLDDRVTYLEQLCQEMNANLTTIQAFVRAHENDISVTSVEKVSDGFVIMFSDGSRYSLKNGEKGGKGEQGPEGPEGPEGKSPVVSIQKGADGGYYWTVNGEQVMIDGKPVSALGVTPKLKIEDKKWMISYDDGATWQEVAPAYDTSSNIQITEDEDAVYFTLAGGEVFTLAKGGGFGFVLERVKDVLIGAGQTIEIAYTLKQGDESVCFDVRATGGFSAEVVPADVNGGKVKITAPAEMADGYVVITAVKNSTGDVKAQYVTFASGVLTLVSSSHNAPAEGGNVDIVFDTNLDYTVEVPAGCDWIEKAPGTKATTRETATLIVKPNTKGPRSAEVSIVPSGGSPLKVLITQDGDPSYNPNSFTYVLWGVEGSFVGNNMGLTPAVKYGNQFRMREGDAQVTMVPLESDIPAGATVTYTNPGVNGTKNWKFTNNSNAKDGISGFNAEDGSFRLAPNDNSPFVPRVHVAAVTVTVSGLGGEADVPVTKVIPIFVDQNGYKAFGSGSYRITYTPFVLRADPATGGELSAPVIEELNGGDASKMALDHRRNFFYFNLNGPAAHSNATAISATNGETHFLGNIWRGYYGDAVNYGGCSPVSYFNDHNSEVEGKLSTTGLYIDNANGLKLVLNPGKFVDSEGVPGNGVFIGTVVANDEGANPISAQKGEVWPFAVWLDPGFAQ